MLHATTPPYSTVTKRLNELAKTKPLPVMGAYVLSAFARNLVDKQILSADVVIAWRDVGEKVLRKNLVTFGQWVEIDKGFEDYINAIYGDYAEFGVEVIAQKNMDIRNGETL